MRTQLLVCVAILATIPGLAAPSDEDQLRTLSDNFDRAIAAHDFVGTRALLSEQYLYVEPEPHRPVVAGNLDERAGDRLTRNKCWCDDPPTIQIAGDTAIISGRYRVLDPCGDPTLVVTGRFTATWIRTPAGWRLLAEHRSPNGEPTVVTSQQLTNPSRPLPTVVTAAKESSGLPAATAAGSANSDSVPTRRSDVATSEQVRAQSGLLPRKFTNLFRAYEPNSVGYAWDEGDETYLDFTFSAMFPIWMGQTYPAATRQFIEKDFFRDATYRKPNFYFAGTIRSAQYIGTRPSSPVVGRRFNPLFSARFWAENKRYGRESEDNFFEVVYGHESNGQFIASKARFNQQWKVYRDQEEDVDRADPDAPQAADLARRTAYHSARDNISRGWDYVGLQFARDWDGRLCWIKDRDVTMAVRFKFNYYLKEGLMQGEAEEYNEWEHDPEGKPRNQVDGLSLRYTIVIPPKCRAEVGTPTLAARTFRFERRYAFTWTTGYVDPFRYNTFKVEAGVMVFNFLPLTLWGRYGYNSDLVDYYHKDYSLGLALSFWDF